LEIDMAGKFHHEVLHRGQAVVARLARAKITLCGVGAVGSNLAENLARQGAGALRAVDHDRVEEHNVSTQAYGLSDVGVWKVEALRNRLFRAAGAEIEPVRKQFTAQNAKQLLAGSDLVIDSFDNSASRALVQGTARALRLPCLHVGLAADYFEAIWDEAYRVPGDAEGDVCDYPLARNLVTLAVSVAAEAILRFIADGRRDGFAGTLGDFAVRPVV
jgi:molybdopterin/thiamine biosynthesis adenylyltransferase